MSHLVFKLEYKSSADGYCKENVDWTKKKCTALRMTPTNANNFYLNQSHL
jgi:hypothetical protein